LKKLKEKAAFKNPDEFYHKMLSKKEGAKYTHEALQLMNTQDIGYINLKNTAEMKKIEKLQDSLHCLATKPVNTHTIFVDTVEDAEQFDPVEYFHTIPEAVERTYNRPTIDTLQTENLFVNNAPLDKVEKEKNKAYTELVGRMDRKQILDVMLDKMNLQKTTYGKRKKKENQIRNKNICSSLQMDKRTEEVEEQIYYNYFF